MKYKEIALRAIKQREFDVISWSEYKANIAY